MAEWRASRSKFSFGDKKPVKIRTLANPTKRFWASLKDLAKQWQVYFAVFTALSLGKNCSAIDVCELNLPWLLGHLVNNIRLFLQGSLTEGEGSLRLTSLY